MQQVGNDPASLQNLHDIVVPDPVGWWPPAAGWYALAVVVACLILIIGFQAFRRWVGNRYRREATAELARIRQQKGYANEHARIAELDVLLKRVALAAWPRETVANLTGERWMSFLNKTSGGSLFDGKASQVYLDVIYCPRVSQRLSADQLDRLFSAAQAWIRTHRASDVSLVGKEISR